MLFEHNDRKPYELIWLITMMFEHINMVLSARIIAFHVSSALFSITRSAVFPIMKFLAIIISVLAPRGYLWGVLRVSFAIASRGSAARYRRLHDFLSSFLGVVLSTSECCLGRAAFHLLVAYSVLS